MCLPLQEDLQLFVQKLLCLRNTKQNSKRDYSKAIDGKLNRSIKLCSVTTPGHHL
jgi:hypothetical protein